MTQTTALGSVPSRHEEPERTPFGHMLHLLQTKYACEGVSTHHGAAQWVVWPIEQMFADALPPVLQAVGGLVGTDARNLADAYRIAAFADRRLNAGILLLHGSSEAAAQAFEKQVIGAIEMAIRAGFRPGMTLSKEAWLALGRGHGGLATNELRGKPVPESGSASTLWTMPTYLFLAACLRKAREVYEEANGLMSQVMRSHLIGSAKAVGQESFQEVLEDFFLLEESEIGAPRHVLRFLGTGEDQGLISRSSRETVLLIEHLKPLLRLAVVGRKIIEASVRLHPELPTSMHMGLLTMWIHTEAVRVILPDAPKVIRPFEVLAGFEQIPQRSIDEMVAAVLARARKLVSMNDEDAALLSARIRKSLWAKFYANPRTPGQAILGNDCDEFIADVYSETQEDAFDAETAGDIATAAKPIPSGVDDHRAFLEHRVLPSLKVGGLTARYGRADLLVALATGPIPFDLLIAWAQQNLPRKDHPDLAHHMIQSDRGEAMPLLLNAGLIKMSDHFLVQYPEHIPSGVLLEYLRKRVSKTMLVDVKAGALRGMARMTESDFQALWREEKIAIGLLSLFGWVLDSPGESHLPKRISWDEVRTFVDRFTEPMRVLFTTAIVAENRGNLYSDVEDMDATDTFEPAWEEIPQHAGSRSYELFSRVFKPAMIEHICATDCEVTAFEYSLGKSARTAEFVARFVRQREVYRARAASFGK